MYISALSAEAYTATATLYVMVNRVKGGGRAPPHNSPAWVNFSIMSGMYARKRPLPLCVYSVDGIEFSRHYATLRSEKGVLPSCFRTAAKEQI